MINSRKFKTVLFALRMEKINAKKILVGKPECKITLGRHKNRTIIK